MPTKKRKRVRRVEAWNTYDPTFRSWDTWRRAAEERMQRLGYNWEEVKTVIGPNKLLDQWEFGVYFDVGVDAVITEYLKKKGGDRCRSQS